MREVHKVPLLAATAVRLTREKFQAAIDALGDQTVLALGLNPADDWLVDFDAGTVSRDVADVKQPEVSSGG